jgi:hypothetical protein
MGKPRRSYGSIAVDERLVEAKRGEIVNEASHGMSDKSAEFSAASVAASVQMSSGVSDSTKAKGQSDRVTATSR